MACYAKKHGMYKTRIYRTYNHMKERCAKLGLPKGNLYFEKGIRVCEEWLGENGFENFCSWAYSNGYDDSLSLDRIDGDKGYSPDNCRWVNYKIQNNNTSRNHLISYNGETHTIGEWATILDIPYNTLNGRIFNGVPPEIAFMKKHFKRGEIKKLITEVGS